MPLKRVYTVYGIWSDSAVASLVPLHTQGAV